MEFFHGVVALLALIVLIVAGLVAWLYVQQTRLLQAVNALAIAIATPPPSYEPPVDPPSVDDMMAIEQDPPSDVKEDDRVSVYEEEDKETVAEFDGKEKEIVDEDTDFSKKTVVELRELLSAKGIPFNKSDKKPVLVSILRATS